MNVDIEQQQSGQEPQPMPNVVLCESDAKVRNVIMGILKSLKVNCITVDSGKDALAEMHNKKVKVFIINEHLLDMSAFQFAMTTNKTPSRIILLSQKPTKQLVMRAIQYGMVDVLAKYSFDISRFAMSISKHLGLPEKPWAEAEVFDEKDELEVTQPELQQDKVDANLSAIPSFANKILQVTMQEDAQFSEIEEYVNLDPVMSAKVLQIANSPLYQGSQQLLRTRDAIRRLGLKKLRKIVLSMQLSDEFNRVGYFIEGKELIKYNLLVATIAKYLYSIAGEYDHEEVAFTAGLIHNLGILILAKSLETDYLKVLEHAVNKNRVQMLFEQKYFAADYISAAVSVFDNWSIPPVISEAVAHQMTQFDVLHKKQLLDKALVMSVNLAQKLVGLFQITRSNLESIQVVPEGMLKYFKIDDIFGLLRLMNQVQADYEEQLNAFGFPERKYVALEFEPMHLFTFGDSAILLRNVLKGDVTVYDATPNHEIEAERCLLLVHDKYSLFKAAKTLELISPEAECLVLCCEKHLKICKAQMSHNNLKFATAWYLNKNNTWAKNGIPT